ncbi:MAG: hypothetical protein R3272_05615 [Candidatus Promineifilaceae bacterium]|nr:hypothetical protein [Candidatus Promineifilaceae bacterium]
MNEVTRADIRRLLKRFGIQADQALVEHLEHNPDVSAVRVRITLEDLTDYGANAPQERLHLEVEEVVRQGEEA